MEYCSIILFATYLIATLVMLIGKNKALTIPDSLSDTAYLWEEKVKGGFIYFVSVMFSVTLLTIVPLIETAPDSVKFLAFLACAGIGFVGAAPFFKRDSAGRITTQTKVHFFSAGLSSVCAVILYFVCIGWSWMPLYLAGGISLLAFLTKSPDKRLFWIEMWLFALIYLILL